MNLFKGWTKLTFKLELQGSLAWILEEEDGEVFVGFWEWDSAGLLKLMCRMIKGGKLLI